MVVVVIGLLLCYIKKDWRRNVGRVARTNAFDVHVSDEMFVTVLRVGDAWLVGVGKRAPHGSRCF